MFISVSATMHLFCRYEIENVELSKTTSDINQKRDDKKKDTAEIKQLKSKLEQIEKELNEMKEKKRQKHVELSDARAKLNSHIQKIANRPSKVVQDTWVFFIHKRTVTTNENDLATLKSMENIYNSNQSEMDAINREEQKLMNDKMDISMKLIQLEIKMGKKKIGNIVTISREGGDE